MHVTQTLSDRSSFLEGLKCPLSCRVAVPLDGRYCARFSVDERVGFRKGLAVHKRGREQTPVSVLSLCFVGALP